MKVWRWLAAKGQGRGAEGNGKPCTEHVLKGRKAHTQSADCEKITILLTSILETVL